MGRRPATGAAETLRRTPPCEVNLKAFESRFFSTCWSRLASVTMPRPSRLDDDVEGQPLALRLVPECASHHIEEVGEQYLFGVDGHRAGLDLREVENVGDQVEQVSAGAVDRAREFDLLRRQVALRIVGQLLAQDQNAVQRRPQLVRHVGQELGLVAGGQRELGRLVFERATGLFDFLILAFDLDVLFGKLLRLLRQLLVGLLQLLLRVCNSPASCCDCLSRPSGLHRRFDAVQHDADAGGQLFEEREVRGREVAQRREAKHRFDLTFEHDREYHDVTRKRLEEDRPHGHRIFGNIRDQQAPLGARALTDESLADS